jgi:4a-hydroxytetrahydrobiopterin dehydratase
MLSLETLAHSDCSPLDKNAKAMIIPSIESHLSVLPHWQASFDYKAIERSILFKNHYQVMAFLNALSYISHKQDHYPIIKYAYNKIDIKLQNEQLNGVTPNDMIMAAKIEKLLNK